MTKKIILLEMILEHNYHYVYINTAISSKICVLPWNKTHISLSFKSINFQISTIMESK